MPQNVKMLHTDAGPKRCLIKGKVYSLQDDLAAYLIKIKAAIPEGSSDPATPRGFAAIEPPRLKGPQPPGGVANVAGADLGEGDVPPLDGGGEGEGDDQGDDTQDSGEGSTGKGPWANKDAGKGKSKAK